MKEWEEKIQKQNEEKNNWYFWTKLCSMCKQYELKWWTEQSCTACANDISWNGGLNKAVQHVQTISAEMVDWTKLCRMYKRYQLKWWTEQSCVGCTSDISWNGGLNKAVQDVQAIAEMVDWTKLCNMYKRYQLNWWNEQCCAACASDISWIGGLNKALQDVQTLQAEAVDWPSPAEQWCHCQHCSCSPAQWYAHSIVLQGWRVSCNSNSNSSMATFRLIRRMEACVKLMLVCFT